MAKKRQDKNSADRNFFAPDESEMKIMFMMALAEMGVTPEEYGEFLVSNEAFKKSISNIQPERPPSPNILEVPIKRKSVKSSPAIKDAGDKTLIIQIKMKDVAKPPMWRQLEVPADFNFTQLHYAIQAATGLMNCHLWQFQEHAYNSPYSIGIPIREEFGFGIDDSTHNADETPVTSFLAKKGDKIEYVYDFGDDWIFEVSVKDVVERKEDVATCTKWKSDLQPMEDSGGVWTYLTMRDFLAHADEMTKAKKDKAAREMGFEDYNTLMMHADDNMIDIEFVNEQLAEIPDCWEDID